MKTIFAMLILFGAQMGLAQSYDPIVSLADLRIGPSMRRYSVNVRSCASAFNSVMLRVSEAGVEVSGAGVIYTDGSVDDYSGSYTFPAGYDSPWISIESFKNNGKCIRAVFVNAQSTDPQVRSHVRVYGN